jgi:hypothetical protein
MPVLSDILHLRIIGGYLREAKIVEDTILVTLGAL